MQVFLTSAKFSNVKVHTVCFSFFFMGFEWGGAVPILVINTHFYISFKAVYWKSEMVFCSQTTLVWTKTVTELLSFGEREKKATARDLCIYVWPSWFGTDAEWKSNKIRRDTVFWIQSCFIFVVFIFSLLPPLQLNMEDFIRWSFKSPKAMRVAPYLQWSNHRQSLRLIEDGPPCLLRIPHLTLSTVYLPALIFQQDFAEDIKHWEMCDAWRKNLSITVLRWSFWVCC